MIFRFDISEIVFRQVVRFSGITTDMFIMLHRTCKVLIKLHICLVDRPKNKARKMLAASEVSKVYSIALNNLEVATRPAKKSKQINYLNCKLKEEFEQLIIMEHPFNSWG